MAEASGPGDHPSKRVRGSPTGYTPTQESKKQKGTRRRLEYSAQEPMAPPLASLSTNLQQPSISHSAKGISPSSWRAEETNALIEFMALHNPTKWACTKDENFWKCAADFVRQRSKQPSRTGGACRSRVVCYLQKNFSSPEEAEQSATSIPSRKDSGNSDFSSLSHASCMQWFQTLPRENQIDFISCLFQYYTSGKYPDLVVPPTFLELSLKAMAQLKKSKRSNILFALANGLGTVRDDLSDTLIPSNRMPMGLLEHVINFYQSSKVEKCPADYRLWLESMYILFGTKWTKLYNGPMWSSESSTRDPLKARVNVPGLSSRAIQQSIANKGLSASAKIQYAALDEAKHAHPNAVWWIKGDGCDLVEGLAESTQKVWSGDVDLVDGELQKSYDAYIQSLNFASKIGLPPRHHKEDICADLRSILGQLTKDLDVISSLLVEATDNYSKSLGSGKGNEKHYRLGWKVDDLSHLNTNGRQMSVDISALLSNLQDCEYDFSKENLPRQLTDLRNRISMFITALSKHTRKPASHIFVFMISPSTRDKKPYAIPIQCVPYRGLKEDILRRLVNNIVHEMHHRQMKVAGFVTNGEFNSFRVRGYKRPISIFQIKSNARAKYSTKGESSLLAMLTPIRKPDGSVVAKLPNQVVSESLLLEILSWRGEGATDLDVITRLRQRTVPDNYSPTSWIRGKTEDRVEMLRSILAQLEYTYEVCKWDCNGVPFRMYIYVPEVHHITGKDFFEREDEGHVFKRIGTSTRQGGPKDLKLQRYVEALEDPLSNLTYPALTGQRAQSVTDVERLFCSKLLAFMRKQQYEVEGDYIEVVLNWRRACDERGLSELQRCRFNYKMLNYILDELMPWHRTFYDFSLLEVNRSLSGIRGFTRETVIALTTNIEGREFQRRMCDSVEHPRASTTDDVECFFSLLRDNLGRDFTLKHVQYEWRKMCVEFLKRIDPELPYYYFTSSHDRFYEDSRPSFSIPSATQSKNNPRQQRPRRFEQSGKLVHGRATLATPGARSLRMQFHNIPVDIPPPPSSSNQAHTFEHSYAAK